MKLNAEYEKNLRAHSMCHCAAKLVGFLACEAYIIGTQKVRN